MQMARKPAMPVPEASPVDAVVKTWVVYILICADNSLYTGITVDLSRRFRQHNQGKASRYTRSRLPVRLMHQESQPSHGDALRREAAIKKLSQRQKWSLVRQSG